jgi:hypothetical protein
MPQDDLCYSPFGYGACDPDLHCTVFECGAEGVPVDICGDSATCIDFLPLFGLDLFACLKTCASADDCLPLGARTEGDACADVDLDPNMTLECFPFCLSSDECRDGEVCAVGNRCVTP